MFKRGLCVALLLTLATATSAQDRKPPYWASIASGEAMMRTGPDRNYPGIWLYKRRDLPIRVVQIYPNWRKIEDPDGQQGWMLVTLLSDRRTGIVKPGSPRDIHSKADPKSPVRYRAEQGVVGAPAVRHVLAHVLGQRALGGHAELRNQPVPPVFRRLRAAVRA